MCHVAHSLNFEGASTCAPRGITCRGRPRTRHVEHICSTDKLISVVVIAIWLRVIRRLFLELQGLVGLFCGCSELVSTSGSICGYVSVTSPGSSALGKISGEHTYGFPSVFLISSVEKSDCIGISRWLAGTALSFVASKIGCSKLYSHALAYKSS